LNNKKGKNDDRKTTEKGLVIAALFIVLFQSFLIIFNPSISHHTTLDKKSVFGDKWEGDARNRHRIIF
jgi:hypothetical protein